MIPNLVAAGIAASALALAPAAVGPPKPIPIGPVSSATVSVSDTHAGARPVRLVLTLRYEMQCGNPGVGTLVVRLPAALRVRSSLPPHSVLLDGRTATARLHGHRLVVELPPRPRIMCDVIGPGKLRLEVTKAAGLGNPLRAGSYAVVAARGTRTFTARLRIR